MEFIYRLVAADKNGRFTSIDTDLFSIQSLVHGIETNRNIREELQQQPKLIGYLGPMWDGYAYKVGNELIPEWKATDLIKNNANKVGIIRYETQNAYNRLSI